MSKLITLLVPNAIRIILTSGAVLTVAIIHPLVLVFEPTSIKHFGLVEILCLGIFVADAALKHLRSPSRTSSKVKRKRIDTVFLAIDLVVLLPIAWFPFYSTPSVFVLVPLLKLFPVNRDIVEWNQQFDLNPMFLRLLLFAFWALVLAHLAACGWIILDNPLPNSPFNRSTYIRALYWAITTLTTVGYGDISAHTDGLKIYSMLVMLIGVGVYGFVIGNIASMFANLDLARQSFRNRVDNVLAYLRYQNTPKDLQQQARQYFDYLWDSQVGHNDQQVLQELPASMRNDVLVHLHRTLVQNVPFFKNADNAFVLALIPQLTPEVWVPGQIIFNVGDTGEHMYFVSRGEVEIRSDQGDLLTTLSDGDFFGEIALIKAAHRQASATAVSYCTTCVLSRHDLQGLLDDFPGFKDMLEKTMQSYNLS